MKVMNPRLVRMARKLDFFWTGLSKLAASTAPPAGTATVTTILVIDLHLVGDMVMLLPLLRALRNAIPRGSNISHGRTVGGGCADGLERLR